MAEMNEILKTINRIKYTPSPKFIYKFTSLNKYLYKNIINNQMWFSDPFSFNDPFDCQYGETTGITENQIQFIDIQDKKHFSKKLIGNVNKYMKKIRVNCFCDLNEKSRTFLLWSHYGDSHKGVCIKYDLETLGRFCNDNNHEINIQKIHYSREFPSLPIFYNENKKDLELLLDILYTKSIDWEYEQEVRIFYNKNILKIDKDVILEIQFGCRVDLDERKDLIQLIKKCNYPNIKFFQARKSKTEFALEFEEII